jgi:hypothetical protein
MSDGGREKKPWSVFMGMVKIAAHFHFFKMILKTILPASLLICLIMAKQIGIKEIYFIPKRLLK